MFSRKRAKFLLSGARRFLHEDDTSKVSRRIFDKNWNAVIVSGSFSASENRGGLEDMPVIAVRFRKCWSLAAFGFGSPLPWVQVYTGYLPFVKCSRIYCSVVAWQRMRLKLMIDHYHKQEVTIWQKQTQGHFSCSEISRRPSSWTKLKKKKGALPLMFAFGSISRIYKRANGLSNFNLEYVSWERQYTTFF